jgi:hypothetical protein
MRVFADRALWHYVFNIHTISEFDQMHFYVAGFCQITRSRHHAFQSNRIGSDQRRIPPLVSFARTTTSSPASLI